MKLHQGIEKKFFGKYVSYGYHLQRFCLEFTIDKYNFSIGLGFVYVSLEF